MMIHAVKCGKKKGIFGLKRPQYLCEVRDWGWVYDGALEVDVRRNEAGARQTELEGLVERDYLPPQA